MTESTARHPLLGSALGLLAVALFGATLPVTRWALAGHGDADGQAAGLTPMFITFARAVGAAAVSCVFLVWTKAPRPQGREWLLLALASVGNAVLYPLSLAVALQTQSAAHVAVITALLPLCTAAVAAWWSHTSPGGRGHLRFWICALLSTGVVAWFSVWRGGQGFHPIAEDLLLVVGVLSASVGYVFGVRVAQRMGPEATICWLTVVALPVSVPLTIEYWPAQPVGAQGWAGVAWLSLVSMWAAFFAWYRALDWGGPLRVSQLQSLQPFFSIAIAWPLVGEAPEPATLAFALAVVALVATGTWRPRASPSP